jgi:hypothetical protein
MLIIGLFFFDDYLGENAIQDLEDLESFKE